MTETEDNETEQAARDYLGPKQPTIPWEVYYASLAKLIKVTKDHKRAAYRFRKIAEKDQR